MLWAKYDVDAKNDGEFSLMRREFGIGAWEMFLALVETAKKANCKGELLVPSGKPCTALHLAATHQPWLPIESELERWERFIKLCLEMKLIVEDEGVLRISDWRRWHCSPSADPELVKERVQKSRESRYKQDVTSCNESNELKRDVTNVTTQSRAEQSRAEQRIEEQTSISLPYDKQGEVFEPSDCQFFSELCHETFKRLSPTGILSENLMSKAKGFRERNRGQPGFQGHGITDADVTEAWKIGAQQTLAAIQNGKPPNVPWNYCISIAQEKLSAVVERRIEQEAISKRRKSS